MCTNRAHFSEWREKEKSFFQLFLFKHEYRVDLDGFLLCTIDEMGWIKTLTSKISIQEENGRHHLLFLM